MKIIIVHLKIASNYILVVLVYFKVFVTAKFQEIIVAVFGEKVGEVLANKQFFLGRSYNLPVGGYHRYTKLLRNINFGNVGSNAIDTKVSSYHTQKPCAKFQW